MKDIIIDFFNAQFPFNQQGLSEFSESFITKTYQKGEMVAIAGDQEKKLHFLINGKIREFYSYNGKEMNTRFFVKPQFITDFYALINNQQTKKFQECLIQVTIKEMSKDTFEDFILRYQCGKEFVEKIFKNIIAEKEEEEFKHFSLTPDELYLDLLSNKPEWLQEIPLYHIATYLRMTPETLSRIRKRN